MCILYTDYDNIVQVLYNIRIVFWPIKKKYIYILITEVLKCLNQITHLLIILVVIYIINIIYEYYKIFLFNVIIVLYKTTFKTYFYLPD